MEKYGVDEDLPTEDKTASSKGACPKCGKKVRPIEVTGVLLCPECGSKPFEQEPPSLHDHATTTKRR